MKKAIIQVPSMQSEHCQLRVKEAVKNLHLTTLVELKPGQVEIDFQNQAQVRQIEQTIEELGYPVQTKHFAETDIPEDKTYRFKTNINCSGCVAKVTPHLAETKGIGHWEVDTANNEKILTVQTEGATAAEIISTVEKAGFKIESI